MADTLTDADLDAIEALSAKASPPPWRVTHDVSGNANGEVYADVDGDGYCVADFGGYRYDADALLVAAMRNALPLLVAALRRERARVRELEEQMRDRSEERRFNDR